METIDTNIYIPLLNAGEKIYHYTTAEGLVGICDNEFWATEQGFLNDKAEFSVATGVICDVLRTHISNDDVYKKLEIAINHRGQYLYTPGMLGEETAYFGYYIISFGLCRDNMAMWNEYADKKGYCIAFDLYRLLSSFEDSTSSMYHGKVIYDRREQINVVEKTIENEVLASDGIIRDINSWDDFNSISEQSLSEFVSYTEIINTLYGMFFKSECFKTENEYRVVFCAGHDGGNWRMENTVIQHFRIKNGALIPFIRKKFNTIETIEEVIIGPTHSMDFTEKGLTYYFRNKRIPINIVRSEVPLRY